MDTLEPLVRRAQAGDDSAFEALLNNCYDSMFRFALKYCGDVHNAEDITHQACLKLAGGLQQFRFEAAFSSWLYRLVINCARDWQRKHAREAERLTATGTTPEASEAGAAENLVHLQQVIGQISAMGDGYREAAALVFGESMSHREAATVLETSESTISWRIHEIRKHLAARGGENL